VLRRSRLIGKQVATMVQPPASPRHEPTLEAERILMVDITSTPARAKEMAPPTSREGGGAGRGHRDQAPKQVTSTHHIPSGQDVLSTGRDLCHCRYATSRIHLMAPVRANHLKLWSILYTTSRLLPLALVRTKGCLPLFTQYTCVGHDMPS
jgi:hypothetical protein